MGFFRRITAFILGIVFTITTLLGGVVGGAYYAYKNVRPLEPIISGNGDSGLGDLEDASIEELIDVVYELLSAKEGEDYTFARLKADYGVDLYTILGNAGIDLSGVDQNSDQWKSLENISVTKLLNEPASVLDTVELETLFIFLPVLVEGKSVDDLLSKEAQAKLGSYTIAELIALDEATGELGLMTALKGLKLGSILPIAYDAVYDAEKHEYTYTLKEDGPLASLTFLDLLGNVNLKGVVDVIGGSDFMEEMMEGDLRELSDKSIKEVLDAFIGVAGEDTLATVEQYTKLFGDVKVADLFTKNEEGAYDFDYMGLVEGIELGYVLGYSKGADGVWYTDEEHTEPAKGLLAVVADLDIGAILENKDDVLTMIDEALGDVSLKTIYATVADPDENGEYPVLIERLGMVTVHDIIGDGPDHIVDNLKDSLIYAIGQMTLRDVIGSIASESVQESLEEIAVVDALLDIKVKEFIQDEYTAESVIGVFNDAIGHLSVGEIAQMEQNADGTWAVGNDLVSLLFDYKIGNIFDVAIDVVNGAKPEQILEHALNGYTLGDFFGAALGYDYDDGRNAWGKDGEYIAESMSDLLAVELWELAATFIPDSGVNVLDDIGAINLGDLAYTACILAGVTDVIVPSADGYVADGDLENLSKALFDISVDDIRNSAGDAEFWKDQISDVKIGDILAIVINELSAENKATYENGEWIATGPQSGVIGPVFNITIGELLEDATSIEFIRDSVGGVTLGDIVGSLLGDLADNNAIDNLLDTSVNDIMDIVEALGEGDTDAMVDTIVDILGDTSFNDVIDIFYEDDMPLAVLDTILEGEIGGLVESIVDGTVTDYIVDLAGTITLDDLVGEYLGDLADNNAISNILDTSVSDVMDIIDAAGAGDTDGVVDGITDIIGDTTFNDIIDIFYEDDMPLSVLDTILDGSVAGLVESIVDGEIVDYVIDLTGDITPADILDDLDILPDEIRNNDFIDATLNVSVEDVYSIIQDPSVENITGTLADVYNGVTVGDILDLAGLDVSGSPALEEIADLDIGKVLDGVANENYDYLGEVGEKVFNSLDETTQAIVIGAAAAAAVVLYIVDPEAVIQIIDDVFGRDATWGDILAEPLEYTFNDGYYYTSSGLYNSLMDLLFAHDVGETLEPGFDFVEEFKYDLTLGNILTAVPALEAVIEDVTGGTFKNVNANSFNSESGIKLEGDFENVLEIALNVSLGEILDAENVGQFLIDTFQDTSIEDLVGPFLPEDIAANKFIDATVKFDVTDLTYVLTAEYVVEVLAVFEELYADVIIGNVVELFAGSQDNFGVPALDKVYAINIGEAIGAIIDDKFGAFITERLGDITLDDLVGSLITDDLASNGFIIATLALSVNDFIDAAEAKTVVEVLDIFIDAYDGVTVGDLTHVIYAEDTGIDVIENVVYPIGIDEILLAVAELRIGQFLTDRLGGITLNDLVGGFIDEKLAANEFISASLSISVNDIIDTVNAGDVQTALAIYEAIYSGVTVADVVELEGQPDNFGITALDKVYAIDLGEVIGAIADGEIVDFLIEKLGEINLNDVVGSFIPEDLLANEFIAASLQLSINNIIDIIRAEKVVQVLAVFENLYEDVTLGHIVEIFLGNQDNFGIPALDVIYGVVIGRDTVNGLGLITAVIDNEVNEWVKAVFGGITVEEMLGDYAPTVMFGNAFGEATLAITVNDIIEIVEGGDVLGVASRIYDGVSVGDLAHMLYSQDTGINAVDNIIYPIEISDVLDAIADGAIGDWAKNEFSAVSIDDLAGQWIPAEIAENNFVAATLAVTVGDILSIVEDPTVENIFGELSAIYDGVILGDIFDIFGVEAPADPAIAEIWSIDLGKLFNAVATGDYQYVIDTATKAFELLDEGVQIGIIAGVAVVAVALYFVDNALLCELVGSALGEDAIWADLLAEALGYSLDGERYVGSHVYNGLLDKFLGSNVVETITAGYDFKANYAHLITLGNLLTAHSAEVDGIENAIGLTFANDADGDVIFEGYLENITKSLFNKISLADVLDREFAEVIKSALGENVVGDVLAILINSQNVASIDTVYNKVEGKWIVTGTGLVSMADKLFNLSFNEISSYVDNDDVVGLIKYLVDQTTIGEVVTTFYAEDLGINVINTIYAIKIMDIVDAVETDTVGEFLEATFSATSINDVVGKWITSETAANDFVAASVSFTVADALIVARAEYLVEILAVFEELYTDVAIRDITDLLIGDIEVQIPALDVVLDLVIGTDTANGNGIITAVIDQKLGDWARRVFGGITVEDILGQYAPIAMYENNIGIATLAITVNDILDILAAENVLDAIGDVYVGSTLGDIPAFAGVDDMGIAALTKIYAIDLGNTIKAIANGTIAEYAEESLSDISIGDIVSTFLTEDLLANDFIEATLSFTVADGLLMARSENPAQILEVVEALYTDVSIRDITDLLIGDIEVQIPALDVVLDLIIGTDTANGNGILTAVIDNELGEWARRVFGGITVEDMLGEFALTAMYENNIGIATLAITVNDILDILAAENVLDAIGDVYVGSTLGDIPAFAGVDDMGIAALTKIYAIDLGNTIKAIANGTIAEFAEENLSDISIGDIVSTFLTEDLLANDFIAATLEFNVADGLTIARAEYAAQAFAVFEALYTDVTISDIVAIAMEPDSFGVPALDVIYNIVIGTDTANGNGILTAVIDNELGAWAKEVFGGITVEEMLGNYAPTVMFGNAFGEATLAITVNDIIEIVEGGDVLGVASRIYDGVSVGDLAHMLYSQDTGINAVENVIYPVLISDVLDAIADGTIGEWAKAQFGDVSIDDLAGQWIPAEIAENTFVAETLAITVNDVIAMVESGSAQGVFGKLAEIYATSTVGNIIEVFGVTAPTEPAIEKLWSTGLATIFNAVETGDATELTEILTEAFELLPEGAQIGIIAGAAVAAVALYFIDNEALCTIVENVFGADAIWADLLAEPLGYSLDGERYMGSHVYNGLLDTLLSANMIETLSDGYDFKANFAGLISLGNLLTAHGAEVDGIENAIGLTFANDADGDVIFEGYLENITKSLFNKITLTDILDKGIVTALKDAFGENVVGDVLAILINSQGVATIDAVYNKVEGKWIVTGTGLVSFADRLFNLSVNSIIEYVNNDDIAGLIKYLVGETTIGEVVTTFYAEDLGINVINTIYAIKIMDIVDAVETNTVGEFLEETFSATSINDVVGKWITSETAANDFVAASVSFTVADALAIVRAEYVNEIFAVFEELYTDVAIRDITDLLIGDIEVQIPALDVVLDLVIGTDTANGNGILTAVIDDEIGEWAKEVFGGITVEDILGQYAPTAMYENNIGIATLAISVNDVLDILAAENVLDAIGDVYVGSTLGDIPAFAGVGDFDNEALAKIYAIDLGNTIKAIANGTIAEFAEENLSDISLGDAAGSYLAPEIAENGFIAATLEFTVADGLTVARATTVIGILEVFEELYTDVAIRDITDLFIEEIPADIPALDVVLDLVIGTDTANGNGILTAVIDQELGAWAKEVFGGITIEDMLGQYAPKYMAENAFGEATLEITVNDVIDLITAPSAADATRVISSIYEGITFGDFAHMLYSQDTGVNAVDNIIYPILISEVLDAVADGTIGEWAKNKFGAVSFDDVVGQWIPAEIAENGFVSASLAITVSNIIDMVASGSVQGVCGVFSDVYTGVTVSDVTSLVGLESTSSEAINTLLNIDLGSTLECVELGSYTYLTDTVKDAASKMTTTEKVIVGSVIGVSAVALYFINNELLCSIIDKVLGEGATVYDVLGEALGYSLDGDKYVGSHVYNSLMDKVMGSVITDLLSDGYDFRANFARHVTIGNLLTLHKAEVEAIENALGLSLGNVEIAGPARARDREVADSSVIFEGYLENISRSIFNGISLEDILAKGFVTAAKAALRNNLVGDVFAMLVNNLGFVNIDVVYNANDNKWIVTGDGLISLTDRAFNMSIHEVYGYVKVGDWAGLIDYVVAETTIGEVVRTFYTGDLGINVINTVYGIVIMDIVDAIKNGTVGKFLEDTFSATSINDVVGKWITSEIAANEFVAASVSFTVADALAIVRAEYVNEIFAVFEELYTDVAIRDITDLFIEEIPVDIPALDVVLDLVIGTDTANGNGILTAVIDDEIKSWGKRVFGAVTVEQFTGKYTPTAMYGNAFGEATLSITVQDLYDLVTVKSVNEALTIVSRLYNGVTVGDIAHMVRSEDTGINVVDSVIYPVVVSEAIDAYVAGNVKSWLKAEFGGVSLNDVVGQWIPAKISENAFGEATLKFTALDGLELVRSKTVVEALTIFEALYTDITLGDVVALAIDEIDVQIPLLDVVLDLVIGEDTANENGIITAIIDKELKTWAKEVFGGITVEEMLGQYTPKLMTEHTPGQKTLAITVQNLYDLVTVKSVNEALTIISGIYSGVTVGDIAHMAYNKDTGINLVENVIYPVVVTDAIDAYVDGNVKGWLRAEFENVTINDVVGQWMPAKLTENAFGQATLAIDAANVVDMIKGRSVKSIAGVLKGVYSGITVSDVTLLVGLGDSTTSEAFNVLLGIDLGSTLGCVEAGSYTYLTDAVKDAVSKLTTTEKVIVGISGGAAAIALYFINNELLIKIVNKALGEGATVYDVIGAKLGYTLGADGRYTGSHVYNALTDKIMGSVIADVLADGYDFKANFTGLITIGNLLTAHSAEVTAVEKSGLILTNDADDNVIFAGYLENISRSVFNGISLASILDKGFVPAVKAALRDNLVGDVFAMILNNVSFIKMNASYDAESGKWIASGNDRTGAVDRVFNMTVHEVYGYVKVKDYKGLAKYVIGNVTIGEAVSLVYSGNLGLTVVDTIYSIKIIELARAIKNKTIKDFIKTTFGETTIRHCVDRWITPDKELKKIISATLDVSLNDVLAIKNAADNNARLRVIAGIYEGLTVGDVIAIATTNSFGSELISAAYGMKLDELLTAISNGSVERNKYLHAVFEGISLRGAIGSDRVDGIARIKDNAFAQATLDITLGQLYDVATTRTKDSILDLAIAAYEGVTIGNMVSLVTTNNFGSQAVDVVYGIDVAELLTAVKAGSVERNAFLYATLENVNLRDVIGAGRVEGIELLRVNAFAQATLDITLGQIYEVVKARTVSSFMMMVRDSYEGVTLGDAIHLVYSKDFDKAIINKVYDLPISHLADALGRKTIKAYLRGEFEGVTLGEVLAIAGDVANKPVIKEFTFITLGDVYDVARGRKGIMSVIGGVKLGAIVESYAPASFKGSDFFNAVYAMTLAEVNDIRKGGLKAIVDKFGEYTLGDVVEKMLGLTKNADGKWTYNGESAAIFEAVFNIKLSVFSGGAKAGMTAVMDTVKGLEIGALLDYAKDADGNWTKNGEKVSAIEAKLADYTITKLQTEGFDGILNTIYIGEVLGYTTNDNVTWYNGEKEATGIVGKLAGTTINGLKGNGIKDIINTSTLRDVLGDDVGSSSILNALADTKIQDLSTEISNIYLGTAMGYIEGSDAWYSKDSQGNLVLVTGIVGKLAGKKISELENGGIEDIINETYIGEVLGYTTSDNVTWYNGTEEVTGITAKLAGTTINGLKGNGIKNIINTSTLRDVLGDGVEDNPILNALADTEVQSLSTAIGNVKLGVAMGYTLKDKTDDGIDNAKWYDAAENEVTDEIALLLVDKTVNDLKGGSFVADLVDDIKSEVSIGKFLTRDAAGNTTEQLFATLYTEEEWKELTISGLTSAENGVFVKVKALTMGQMIDLGLLTINDTTDALLDYRFNDGEGNPTWVNMDLTTFINALIGEL